MKKLSILLCMATGIIVAVHAQTCATCGQLGNGGSQGIDIGPNFSASLGQAQYGESAGHLTFSSTTPDPLLFTPAALQFTASSRTDVTVITTNEFTTNTITITNLDIAIITSTNYFTNGLVYTNLSWDADVVTNVTTTDEVTTNSAIRQVLAPGMLADIPVPPTPDGYVIDFYFTNQIVGVNPDGTYAITNTPFVTWTITNPALDSIDELQITETNRIYGGLKQWTYTYSTNIGGWTVEDLNGVEKTMIVTNLNTNEYQVINKYQYAGGPVVQQTKTTYTNASWGGAPVEVDVGSDSAPEKTTYTYYNSGQLETVTHPDGSQESYGYDSSGNVDDVQSTFEDNPNEREIVYSYGAGIISGDNGTADPYVPRKTVENINNEEVSLSYTAFLSEYERLDIQCTTPGASWAGANNLVTTNFFYTSGPNQFRLQAVFRPDGTATTYNYLTNADGSCETNITVTGQPDSGSPNAVIVDGVSNVTVLNTQGHNVFVASYDVKTGLPLSRDTYGGFDDFGRPTQVTHLDGTTKYMAYACCGLDFTSDRDGVTNVYDYDAGSRPIGNTKIYGNDQTISDMKTLDAANRAVQTYRVGADNSVIIESQSAYDLAGELIAQTNALDGVTSHTRSNDPNTGGLIRTITDPDGGTITNYYYADGSLKETIGTAVHGVRYVYDVGLDAAGDTCTYTEAIKLKTDGSDSSEITTTYTDMAGRQTEVQYADGSYSQSFYNAQGQLYKQIDPDGVVTLYQYDAKGDLTYTAIDMNRNGVIDFNGTDRITETTNDVLFDPNLNADVTRTRTYVWQDGQSTGTLVSESETSVDGLTNWQTIYRDPNTPVTTESETTYAAPSRTVTTIAPDNSYTTNTYSFGRLVSSTRYDSTGTQIGGTTYTYDPQGRQYQATDARNGTTTYGYNDADLVTSVTTPNPNSIGGAPETTLTYYNNMLQATNVVQPDNTSVISVYLPTGELGETYGSRTYPVQYTYDYAGRMKTMTTWQNFADQTGAATTTWNYDPERGWLTSKIYADGQGPSYTYTLAGKLKTRTWARLVSGQPLKTTYGYDNADDLQSVTYSDGTTPDVTYTYDRLGRQSTIAWSNITETLTYNLANQLLGESYSGGILNGLSVTNGYSGDLLRTNLVALNGSTPLVQQSFGYNAASRLSTVSDGNGNTAAYSYVANSPLVGQITYTQNGTTRMTTTKSYDKLNRLTAISSTGSAGVSPAISFAYQYNQANQRIRDTLADGSYWIYQYDSLGQLQWAHKFWPDETPVAGQQFDYSFDDIGNRVQTKTGGDQHGWNQRAANYYVNDLNQYTSRDVPGYLNILGVSFATNTVTVNVNTAYRKGEYFWDELGVNNNIAPIWEGITVAATGQSSVTGNKFVPQTPEQFSYDADGNLTNDGRWAYTWDAENRLVKITVNTNVGPQYQLSFVYDSQGRRIEKIVALDGTPVSTNIFLYDGWNLIAELGANDSPIRTYMWGNDLSGSSQSAGGVGGLLEESYYGGSSTTNCFVAYDGNGNVAALVNAADGTVAANYEYSPFGQLIRQTGPMAQANPFRFSTKYQDDESDLLYYGYRYYDPSTGRWPNRDPFGELGFELIQHPNENVGISVNFYQFFGFDIYCFLKNSPIDFLDILGLKKYVPYLTIHWRKCSISVGPEVVDDIPKLLKIIHKTVHDIEALHDLIGEEIDEKTWSKYVPDCYVSTKSEDWGLMDHGIDIQNTPGEPLISVTIVIKYYIEDTWDWHPFRVPSPPCLNCNQNNPVPPFP